MAINKKLINFKSKAAFTSQLTQGNILDTSICFIDETQEIYTHGTYFCPQVSSYKVTYSNGITDYKNIQFKIPTIDLTLDNWTPTGILVNSANFPSENGTYAIQIEVNNTIYSGVMPIFIATDVAVDEINTADEIVLSQMGHSTNRLYLKTDKNVSYIFSELYLSSREDATFNNMTITFKKLI